MSEISQVCAWPWKSKSSWRTRGWDSIFGESCQKNPIWRQAQKNHPKNRALKTNTNAVCLRLGGNDWWFLWLHWSRNQFQVLETWWTIIKGWGSLTKNGLREMNYDGENNIILQNQREGFVEDRAKHNRKGAVQFLSISVYHCSAKFPTSNVQSN